MLSGFDPTPALAGGALIGLAAVVLMATHGRIFGATGILAGAFLPENPADRAWRLALLAGILAAPFAWVAATGAMPVIEPPTPRALMALGGVVVGVGVTLGSGCTSGHGVCGIARLSPRSIVATLTFMATTIATVYLLRHVAGV